MSRKSARRNQAWQRKHVEPWPIVLAAGGVLLIGLVAFAVWQAAGGDAGPSVPLEVSGAPRLKVDKDKVDLGNVRLGQTVEVTFTVANVGDRQLRFTETPYIEVVEGC